MTMTINKGVTCSLVGGVDYSMGTSYCFQAFDVCPCHCHVAARERATRRMGGHSVMPTFYISPGARVTGTVVSVSPSSSNPAAWVVGINRVSVSRHSRSKIDRRIAPKDDVWQWTTNDRIPSIGESVNVQTEEAGEPVGILAWQAVGTETKKPRGLSASERRKLAIEAAQDADEKEHSREYA